MQQFLSKNEKKKEKEKNETVELYSSLLGDIEVGWAF